MHSEEDRSILKADGCVGRGDGGDGGVEADRGGFGGGVWRDRGRDAKTKTRTKEQSAPRRRREDEVREEIEKVETPDSLRDERQWEQQDPGSGTRRFLSGFGPPER